MRGEALEPVATSRWLVRLAIVLIALVCSAITKVPAASAAPSPTDAVVLVSGITTTTPFTTPGAICTGKYPRGSSWSYDGASFAAAGYEVYTAPVNYGSGPVVSDPPNFSGCPAQLPASMTIDSKGDIYANARALASFIAYLHSQFGVKTVRFVAHSYGGLWTRGAMRLASSSFPAVQVQSITTLGTPHLGSFMADIGEGVDPSLCGSDLACKTIAELLIAVRETYYEPAMSQATAAAVAQWNAGQGTSLRGIPLTAIGGDAISIKGEQSPYVSPNDLLIGIASAQAVGLQASGVIPDLSCFPAFPDVHSNTFLPFVPSVKYSLLSDPAIVADVEQTLAGNPPSSGCPDPAFQSAPGATSPYLSKAAANEVTVPLRAALSTAGTPTSHLGNGGAIIVRSGTHVSCRGKQLASVPFMQSTALRVIPDPTCTGALRATAGHGVLFLGDTPVSATLQVKGKRIYVRLHGPARYRQLTVAIERGHRFLTRALDRRHSFRFSAGSRTVTVRVALAQGKGRSDVALVTLFV
jgi:triacylglycerol lipase